MKLPQLQKDSFLQNPELFRILNKHVASSYQPKQLLRCLFFHKNNVNTAVLSCEDSVGILRYLANHLNTLKQTCDMFWIKTSLKGLRLFATQHRSVVSIESDKDVIVLPEEIPMNGIDVWASRNEKLLLKADDELIELYDFMTFCV